MAYAFFIMYDEGVSLLDTLLYTKRQKNELQEDTV